jgi:hypothetical protein
MPLLSGLDYNYHFQKTFLQNSFNLQFSICSNFKRSVSTYSKNLCVYVFNILEIGFVNYILYALILSGASQYISKNLCVYVFKILAISFINYILYALILCEASQHIPKIYVTRCFKKKSQLPTSNFQLYIIFAPCQK